MNPHAEGQGRGNPESLAATQECLYGIWDSIRRNWWLILIAFALALISRGL